MELRKRLEQYEESGVTAQSRYSYYGIDSGSYPFGAVKTIQLQRGSDPMLVDREMTYDRVGNVTAVNDRVSGEEISYSYDDLDRLTGAGSPINETYAYSEIGNIAARNGTSYVYADPSHVHAVTSFSGVTYSYDANGGMTSRGTQAVRYDAEMRPVRVNDGAKVLWRASYDGDGARRKRVDGKGTIHYLGGYEHNVGNGADPSETVTKYYRALGRLIAIRKNGILYWIGTDHLGGTVRVADTGFAPVGQMRYMPYGASRDDASLLPHDHLFTDQQLDASIGLYWYASRPYDQSLGRFTCPDTIVPSPGNPQSLNRYAYTYNNPLTYADPTGHGPDPWEGMGVVELANPSFLAPNLREALYEHNMGISNPGWSEGGDGGGGGSNTNVVGPITDFDRLEALKLVLEDDLRYAASNPNKTEVFIDLTNRLSKHYGADPASATAFVRAVGLLFDGIAYSGSALQAVMDRSGQDPNNPSTLVSQSLSTTLNLGPEGMKDELKDSFVREDNQTHHYTAYFILGFEYGSLPAKAMNVYHDGGLRNPVGGSPLPWADPERNEGDLALGSKAAAHGAMLRSDLYSTSGRADYEKLISAMKTDLLA